MRTVTDLAQVLGDLGCTRAPVGSELVAIGGACVDSRLIEPGDLFVALAGENTDGHVFVKRAMEAGAAAALVSRPVEGVSMVSPVCLPDTVAGPVAILVKDTLVALQRLAAARRARRTDVRVVGVTGSVGKTTTKEAIASVLGGRYATLKSMGNHNNEIGLPLTLMSLDAHYSRVVLEMGMYDLGEIALLCDIARPDVGVVTNVRPIHLERLGTLDRIAQAKGELSLALAPGGIAVLNGDDNRVVSMPTTMGVTRIMCGLGERNHIRAVSISSLGMDGVRFTVRVSGLQALGIADADRELVTSTIGRHTVYAALLAIAVGLAEGLGWDEIASGLVAQGHGLRLVPRKGREGIQILDDSYNAGPSSMKAALDVLAEMPGRRVAVLGDMLELGAVEAAGHREVGQHCYGRVDVLLAVGRLSRLLADEAIAAGLAAGCVLCADTSDVAVDMLNDLAQTGDTVLVKGSRSMGLEICVTALGGSVRD